VKIIRKPPPCFETPRGAAKPTENDASQDHVVRCYVVEAAEQNMDETPSSTSLALLKLLEMTEPQTNACVAAGLSMITKDPHYGLLVTYNVNDKIAQKQCTKAIVIVTATTPSVPSNLNEGYQMTTDNVKDPLDESAIS
jgi:hypothetical protein